jgi:hypothetical protein
LCHDYPKDGAEPTSMVTVAESRARNVHVGNGTERETFIEMRTRRDAGLNLPRLIYASLQVNIRGGRAPSAESNGASYLKLPIQATMEELLAGDG